MRKGYKIFWYAGAVLLLFLLWAIASALAALPIIPPPLRVLSTLQQIFYQQIAVHMVYSLGRIFAGLGFAVLVGLPIGLCMGYFYKADRFFSPLVYLTYPIPKIALLPILMLLCGVGEMAKIIMIFMIIVFQVIVAVRDAVHAVPEEMYYPLYSLGASFRQIFSEILWPASLPQFITAVRVAMATAISVLFFTETFGTRYGMGYFIMDAWLRVNYLEMYAGILVLSLMGLFLFVWIDILEWHFCSWQNKK